jgi:hypothetical protein
VPGVDRQRRQRASDHSASDESQSRHVRANQATRPGIPPARRGRE